MNNTAAARRALMDAAFPIISQVDHVLQRDQHKQHYDDFSNTGLALVGERFCGATSVAPQNLNQCSYEEAFKLQNLIFTMT